MKKFLLIVISVLSLASCATMPQSLYVSQKDMLDAELQLVDSFTKIYDTKDAAVTFYPDFFPKADYTLKWKQTLTCISDDIDPQASYFASFIENLYKHQNGFVIHLKHSFCKGEKKVGSYYSRIFDKRITKEYHPLTRENSEKFIVVNPQKKIMTVILVESGEKVDISSEGYTRPSSNKKANVYFFTLSDELATKLAELQSRIEKVKFDKNKVCSNLATSCKIHYQENSSEKAKWRIDTLREKTTRGELRNLFLLAGFELSDIDKINISDEGGYTLKSTKTFIQSDRTFTKEVGNTVMTGDVKSKIVENIQETLR